MAEYTFTVPGRPVGKERPRLGRGRHIYTPQKTKDYEDRVGYLAKVLGGTPFTRCIAHIEYRIPMTKSGTEPMRRPDIDNAEKCVFDGAQRVLYKDDKHILWCNHGYLFLPYGSEPLVSVKLTEVDWTDYIRGE